MEPPVPPGGPPNMKPMEEFNAKTSGSQPPRSCHPGFLGRILPASCWMLIGVSVIAGLAAVTDDAITSPTLPSMRFSRSASKPSGCSWIPLQSSGPGRLGIDPGSRWARIVTVILVFSRRSPPARPHLAALPEHPG